MSRERRLLMSLDHRTPLVGECLSSEEIEHFRSEGLLRAAPARTSVACPNCDAGHIEPVHRLRDSSGNGAPFIACREGGVVSVPEADLQAWRVDPGALAAELRTSWKLEGTLEQLVPGRLWRLGVFRNQEDKRRVLFGVGLHWEDGQTIVRKTGWSGNSVVLVPGVMPPEAIWPAFIPPLIRLREVLVEGMGWAVDHVQVWTDIRDADERNRLSKAGILAEPKLNRLVKAAVASAKPKVDDQTISDLMYECDGNQHEVSRRLKDLRTPLNPGTVSRRWGKILAGREAEMAMADSRGGASFVKGFTGKRRNNKQF